MVLLSNLRWKTRLQGHSKYSVAAGVTGILLYVTVGLLRFSFFLVFIYLFIWQYWVLVGAHGPFDLCCGTQDL